MRLLANKGWQAQEYYNEYLLLKETLVYLQHEIEHCQKYLTNIQVASLERDLKEKTDRLMFLLENLELHGVSMKELVLLSCGIELVTA